MLSLKIYNLFFYNLTKIITSWLHWLTKKALFVIFILNKYLKNLQMYSSEYFYCGSVQYVFCYSGSA